MKKRKWTKLFIIGYVILAALYLAAFAALRNRGYRSYEFLCLFRFALLCLPLVYIWCVGFGNLRRYKIRYPDRSAAGGRALLIIYTLLMFPAIGYLGYRCGVIQPPQWTIHPAALFWQEKTEEPPKEEEKSEGAEKEVYVERPYEKVEDAYHKLYDDVLSVSYQKSEDCYNAKGNFYALLDEGTTEYEGKPADYRITMVYDRISDDGQSHMFVNYKEYTTEEGVHTDFGLEYYVNMETGEIRAQEAPWGD